MQDKSALLRTLLKTFMHTDRLKLIGYLAEQEASAAVLADRFNLDLLTVMNHLQMFNAHQLIAVRHEEDTPYYKLNLRALLDLNKQLFGGEKRPSEARLEEGEAWEQEVLKNFFEGERLKLIPARHKEFLVIIKWLSTKFEFGVRYPEKQVNAMLKEYHEDYATLRRALVDFMFMQRQDGMYWCITSND